MARPGRVAHDRALLGMRGRELLGKYKLGRTLTRDSSGTVYQAKDMRSGAVVAVKELAPELVADTRFIERLRADSGVLIRLDHPNCGRVLDFLEVDGRAYLVSEPIEGRTLREVISGTALRPAQALALLRGTLVGLSAAHALGLLHRSLRPESVYVQPDGLVRLNGFDQPAYAAGAATGAAPSAGGSRYTYIAPDQVVGAEADVRTDVYLAGILGFELLSGAPPFTSPDPSELMSLHVTREPPDLSALRPEVTAPVADIVNRALAKAPDDRQQSAREFIAQIDAATAALGVEWTEAMAVSGLGAAATAGASTLAGDGKSGRGAAPGGARVGRRPRSVLVPGVAALTLAFTTAAYGYSQRWLGVGAGVGAGAGTPSTAQHSGGSPARGHTPAELGLKLPGAAPAPPAAVAPPTAVLLPAQANPASQVVLTVSLPPAPAASPNPPATTPAPPATAPGSAPKPPAGGESESSTDQDDEAQDRDDGDEDDHGDHGDHGKKHDGHGHDGPGAKERDPG